VRRPIWPATAGSGRTAALAPGETGTGPPLAEVPENADNPLPDPESRILLTRWGWSAPFLTSGRSIV